MLKTFKFYRTQPGGTASIGITYIYESLKLTSYSLSLNTLYYLEQTKVLKFKHYIKIINMRVS